MKYFFTPLLGLLLALVSLIVAPIGMLFAVRFIKWDTEPSNGSYEQDPTIRGDLPRRLSWFQTPDERFPGGLYEPTVNSLLKDRGKLICSWYWAGWRNQMMGMAASFGKSTTDYIPESYGMWERGDIWRICFPVIFFRVVLGWQVYRKRDGTFLAVPVCTIKKKL